MNDRPPAGQPWVLSVLNAVKITRFSPAAAGGRENTSDYIEMFAEGSVEHTSVSSAMPPVHGGAVAVCRNPVSLSYLEEHGAKGAYSRSHRNRSSVAIRHRLSRRIEKCWPVLAESGYAAAKFPISSFLQTTPSTTALFPLPDIESASAMNL